MRKTAITAALVLAAFLLGRQLAPAPATTAEPQAQPERQTAPAIDTAASDARIVRAFQERQGGVAVESMGAVIKLLPDDRDGSRHQRFLIELANGHTLLVAHNIDLEPRLDGLQVGDSVAFRGEYEWNAKGGVIHWTHHDPAGRHPGGWLKHDGRTFQ